MRSTRNLIGVASVAAFVIFMSSSSVFADHLDKHDTRKIVRALEERADVLQDRVDEWIDQRREERTHQAEELNRHIDHFEDAVLTLRTQLLSHDEPWDLRDQAKAVIETGRELHEALDHADYIPKDVKRGWDDLRNAINDLARHYKLDPIG